MVLVVPAEAAEEITQRLTGMGERVFRIGHTEQKTAPDEPSLVFDPAPRDPA
jgi:phosphoribosylaminoimidazole (AIR) synthetase